MTTGLPFPNISPEIFSFSLFGMELALRWYALAYVIGFVGGFWVIVRAVKTTFLWAHNKAPFTASQTEDLFTYVILGVVLGGRLGYTLFYNPAHYLTHPMEIFHIWEGGMSFHGGLIGVAVAAALFARKTKANLLSVADTLALAVPLGLLLGRVSNFINGELWGRPTDLPWGVVFPGDLARCGQMAGEMCARHPSQLYEALLEGLVLGTVLLWLAFRRGALRTPGRLTGVFFLGYALARFAVEFVRQPDAQFVSAQNPLGYALHLDPFGLTMGQLLCLPMLALGAFLLWRPASQHSPQKG
jgi:phosphatidylglycerol:prolipoprotein diacylglycerol transferase